MYTSDIYLLRITLSPVGCAIHRFSEDQVRQTWKIVLGAHDAGCGWSRASSKFVSSGSRQHHHAGEDDGGAVRGGVVEARLPIVPYSIFITKYISAEKFYLLVYIDYEICTCKISFLCLILTVNWLPFLLYCTG